MSKIQLNYSSISNVPLKNYNLDFSFIVNGQEFQTSRLIAELLSPKICKIHMTDPTIDNIIINTQKQGDFSRILQLVNFEPVDIQPSEVDFIFEVIGILENNTLNIQGTPDHKELTLDKNFSLLKIHEKSAIFSMYVDTEIEFISSHFFELKENHIEELKTLDNQTICRIIENEKLQLKDEDQLIRIINHLYKNDKKYNILYENVIFENVSSDCMREFIEAFDFNDNGTIKVTTNSFYSLHPPENLLNFKEDVSYFTNGDDTNAWVCFDFKNMKVEVSNYSIQSDSSPIGECHVKNWVFEISDDGLNWQIIDEQSNYAGLNGPNILQTFDVKEKKFSRFCRIRHNGDYWGSRGLVLVIKSVEFYGRLEEE